MDGRERQGRERARTRSKGPTTDRDPDTVIRETLAWVEGAMLAVRGKVHLGRPMLSSDEIAETDRDICDVEERVHGLVATIKRGRAPWASEQVEALRHEWMMLNAAGWLRHRIQQRAQADAELAEAEREKDGPDPIDVLRESREEKERRWLREREAAAIREDLAAEPELQAGPAAPEPLVETVAELVVRFREFGMKDEHVSSWRKRKRHPLRAVNESERPRRYRVADIAPRAKALPHNRKLELARRSKSAKKTRS